MSFFHSPQLTITLLIISLAATGCAQNLNNDRKVEEILAGYRKQAATQKMASSAARTPIRLELEKQGEALFLTGDWEDVPLNKLIQRLFSETGYSWTLDGVYLQGSASASFQRAPFKEALQSLLSSAGLRAEWSNGLATIGMREWQNEQLKEIVADVQLYHLSVDQAIKVLDGIYNDKKIKTPLSYGATSEDSVIYLRGRQNHVFLAGQLLARADRPRGHVVIEALVADYSISDLKALGGQLLGLQSGRFDNVNVNYSNIGNYITFSRNDGLDQRSLSFSGVINAMVSDNKARVITRPYVATLSGSPARIQVAGERYIVTQNNYGSSTTKVPAGVSLEITPRILGDGTIRMTLAVEDSMFSNTSTANVVVETSRNVAEAVVQVEDGQTLVIGGMSRNRHALGNSGFPLLRLIPGLNLLFARHADDQIQKEVVILLTPHLWEPGLEPPLPASDALRIQETPRSF